jgi:serine/threonine-protein kinase
MVEVDGAARGEVLSPGALIAGRYRLDRLLGAGGMGQVWAATHSVTRRSMALKFLHGPLGADPQLRRRFAREARSAAAVSHPGVIEIRDFFELGDGTPVMVMDLLAGESLARHLQRLGALSVEATCRILAQVVSAVGAAHAVGIVHRDLKPDNVFLARLDDGREEVKVLDFGIAKLNETEADGGASLQTGTGAVMGTPAYMAPEQAMGEKDLDHRADAWAIGVILYECLSGRRPIEGDNFAQIVRQIFHGTIRPLHEVAPEVPADLAELVVRLLAVDRFQRPGDLRDVLAVLRAHSDVAVRSIDPAGQLALVGSPEAALPSSGLTITVFPGASLAEAETVAHDPSGSVTPLLVAEIAPAPTPARPATSPGSEPLDTRSRRRPALALALALVAGAVGAWLFVGSRRPPARSPSLAASAGASVSTAPADEPPLRHPCSIPPPATGTFACAGPMAAWCDVNESPIACCGAGLVAMGRDGVCGCPPGGVKDTPDAPVSCPRARGGNPAEGIQAVVSKAFPELQGCYEKALGKGQDMSGRVAVRFEISPEGRPMLVRIGDTTLPDAEAQTCVLRTFRALRFDPPVGGNHTVSYPLEFDFGK